MTKARDNLASDVEQYAREVEESEGSGSLKDGATLLEVVSHHYIHWSFFLVSCCFSANNHDIGLRRVCVAYIKPDKLVMPTFFCLQFLSLFQFPG